MKELLNETIADIKREQVTKVKDTLRRHLMQVALYQQQIEDLKVKLDAEKLAIKNFSFTTIDFGDLCN